MPALPPASAALPETAPLAGDATADRAWHRLVHSAGHDPANERWNVSAGGQQTGSVVGAQRLESITEEEGSLERGSGKGPGDVSSSSGGHHCSRAAIEHPRWNAGGTHSLHPARVHATDTGNPGRGAWDVVYDAEHAASVQPMAQQGPTAGPGGAAWAATASLHPAQMPPSDTGVAGNAAWASTASLRPAHLQPAETARNAAWAESASLQPAQPQPAETARNAAWADPALLPPAAHKVRTGGGVAAQVGSCGATAGASRSTAQSQMPAAAEHNNRTSWSPTGGASLRPAHLKSDTTDVISGQQWGETGQSLHPAHMGRQTGHPSGWARTQAGHSLHPARLQGDNTTAHSRAATTEHGPLDAEQELTTRIAGDGSGVSSGSSHSAQAGTAQHPGLHVDLDDLVTGRTGS